MVYEMNLKLEATALLNNVQAHGSPTPELKRIVIGTVCGDMPPLGVIDKFVVVDNTGTERDVITSFFGSGTEDEGELIGSFEATASYIATKIRAYHDTTPYFETILTTPVTITAGEQRGLQFRVKASMTGAGVTHYVFGQDKFIEYFIMTLVGGAGGDSIRAGKVFIMIQREGGGFRTKTTPAIKSLTPVKCIVNGSIPIEPGDEGVLLAYGIRNLEDETLFFFTITEENLPNAITLLANDRANISIEFSVE